MIIGICAALTAGTCHILLYYFARRVVDDLIYVGRDAEHMTNVKQSSISPHHCSNLHLLVANHSKTAYNSIQTVTRYYVGMGLTSFSELSEQYASEAIRHIRSVVSLHREEHFIHLYEDAFDREFKSNLCHLMLVAFSTALTNSLKYFVYATNFSYGSTLVQEGEMTFQNVFKICAVINSGVAALGRSIGENTDYTRSKQSALRLIKLIKPQSKVDPQDPSGTILDDVKGNIDFDDVSFHYPTRSTVQVLRHFSLTCPARRSTGVAGPSGAGKSTVIDLLQRFYDPVDGQLLLDGHDISTLNVRWFRSLVGLVQQEPTLFNLSIRDNIAYGDNSRQVTQEEIEQVAHRLVVAEVRLLQGYDTMCGSKGSQLSAGQKQRIAIARALIRQPKILLFDEATSALDNTSEKEVQEALEKAKSDRTCVTIAHRLSTIRNSHKISVIEKGKIREEGRHDELVKTKSGVYSTMIAAQNKANQ